MLLTKSAGSPFTWPPGGQNAAQRRRKREMVTGLGAESTQARARRSATELTREGKLPPGVWVICTDFAESAAEMHLLGIVSNSGNNVY